MCNYWMRVLFAIEPKCGRGQAIDGCFESYILVLEQQTFLNLLIASELYTTLYT